MTTMEQGASVTRKTKATIQHKALGCHYACRVSGATKIREARVSDRHL